MANQRNPLHAAPPGNVDEINAAYLSYTAPGADHNADLLQMQARWCTNEPYDVFISYCWAKSITAGDKMIHDKVRKFHNRLVELHPSLRTYLDDKDNWGDKFTNRRILEQLNKSKVVIFCVTKAYLIKALFDTNTVYHEFASVYRNGRLTGKPFIVLAFEPKSELGLPNNWLNFFIAPNPANADPGAAARDPVVQQLAEKYRTVFADQVIEYAFADDVATLGVYKFDELYELIRSKQKRFWFIERTPFGTADAASTFLFLCVLAAHLYSLTIAIIDVVPFKQLNQDVREIDVCVSNSAVQIIGSVAGLIFLFRSFMFSDSFGQSRVYGVDSFAVFILVIVITVGIININFNTICFDIARSTGNNSAVAVTLAINLITICVRMAYVVVWIFLKLRLFNAGRPRAERPEAPAAAVV